MATPKQIAANRRNAQKSTGPRSVEGKAASSRNALQSGIYTQSLIIPGENVEDLTRLGQEYYDRFRPATPDQRALVEILIQSDWLLRRWRNVETNLWNESIDDASASGASLPLAQAFRSSSRHFAILQRRMDSTFRTYRGALKDLERLQAEPQSDREATAEPEQPAVSNQGDPSQIGFVPSLFSDPPVSLRRPPAAASTTPPPDPRCA